MKNKYFKWIALENSVCRVFQNYIEEKRHCKTFFKQRDNKQAPIDFLGRFYNKSTGDTIIKVAIEVRTLNMTKEQIEKGSGYIMFPISKLNELMMFRRMEKETYIVYLLKDKVFFIKWSYYLKYNFEIIEIKKGSFIIKLPIRNFIFCWDYKKLEK